tara:strand:+ start:1776 stop:2294 length:519 start_codon:yes stop_codon:yes gene_type:complete
MITSTSLSHPTMIRKIILAIRQAKKTRLPVYIQNAKGRNIIRVTYDEINGVTDFYSGNRRMGMVVKEAFELFRRVHAPAKKPDPMKVVREELTEIFLQYIRMFNERVPAFMASTRDLITIRNHMIRNAVLKHQRDKIINKDLDSLYKESILMHNLRAVAASIGVKKLFRDDL